jgi:hypothetical protein
MRHNILLLLMSEGEDRDANIALAKEMMQGWGIDVKTFDRLEREFQKKNIAILKQFKKQPTLEDNPA